jgi:copper chaperone NosL
MTRATRVLMSSLALAVAACGSEPQQPAALETRTDACAFCRMTVSNAALAAQIVAPGEEPRFFDDIGCMAAYLKDHPARSGGARAYVADHLSKTWVAADVALYTRVPGLETPMGSHLIAHADASSRDRDPVVSREAPTPVADVFGRGTLPGARP